MSDGARLLAIEDISAPDVLRRKYDLAIFGCGYERRCTFLASRIDPRKLDNALVIAFEEDQNANSRRDNEKSFAQIANSHLTLSGDKDGGLYDWFRGYAPATDRLSVLVDYSSMSRMWYNGIINWIRFTPDLPPVTVDFVYSQGRYATQHQPLVIREILALPGCEASPRFERKTIAAFGLGFDSTVALSVLDRLEPDTVYAFFADPGSSPGDEEKVLITNKTFMAMYAGIRIRLPLASVSTCVRVLEEAMLPSLGRENITLVPLGPKPHVLASLLLCRIHTRELSCLRVSGDRVPRVDVEATGEVVATRVQFGD